MKLQTSFTLRSLLLVASPAVLVAGIAACGSSSSPSTTGASSSSSGSPASSGSSTSSGSTSSASTSSGAGGSTSTASSTGSTTSTSSSGAGGGETGPITAPAMTWTYVPFPNTQCMDGSPAGIGVNLNSASKDVMIYMEGGNACFNNLSCTITANPHGYTETSFQNDVNGDLAAAPIFDRTATTNPVAAYNYIYVPYCTGDIHAGDNDATVAGSMRHFHGFSNTAAFLKRIIATIPNAQHVLLTGSSAGGFGAAFNYDQTVKAFGAGVDVSLLDDSGPPMDVAYVPACLQSFFATTWGLDKTLPSGCANGCVTAAGDFMAPLVKYLTTTYSSNYLGIISSTSDATISEFWAYGNNNCGAGFTGAPPGAYPAGEYDMGLDNLATTLAAGDDNFYHFYIDSSAVPSTIDSDPADTHHTWLTDSAAFGVSVDNTVLSTWFSDFVTKSSSLANVGN